MTTATGRPTFTAHNILLDDGERTLGDAPLLTETANFKAVMRSLTLHFPPEARSRARIVDIGCLEGGYAVEFARAGYDVLGLEAREQNLEKCRYVAERTGLANLQFVQDDAKNIADHGPFDAVFCCGLLYHLDNPDAYLKTLGRITQRMLILHTHYATEENVSMRLLKIRMQNAAHRYFGADAPTKAYYQLSELTTHEGRRGRWFHEYDEDAAQDEIEGSLWASYGNARSFWPCKKDLLESIRTAGFEAVYEQHDFLDDILHDTYVDDHDRGLFIGLKP